MHACACFFSCLLFADQCNVPTEVIHTRFSAYLLTFVHNFQNKPFISKAGRLRCLDAPRSSRSQGYCGCKLSQEGNFSLEVFVSSIERLFETCIALRFCVTLSSVLPNTRQHAQQVPSYDQTIFQSPPSPASLSRPRAIARTPSVNTTNCSWRLKDGTPSGQTSRTLRRH